MCGIAGFINFQDPRPLAQFAQQSQAHRGPDSHRTWVEGPVAFAHQRLSIIDLDKRSDQPFEKDDLIIIFNGEIYNYQQLRDRIEQQDPSVIFHTTSDTEVLLEWFRLKGENCTDDLIGMFAFAVYNRSTKKLFLARDHFGIKPLFYTFINNSFAFASELKTLVGIPGFQKSINYTALVGAINYLWVPGNETMFTGCFKLPPAHYMIINTLDPSVQPQIKRYWHLNTTIAHSDEKETVEALATYLEASVERHMIADVPVSSFLSGGLDSSLISVITARKVSRLSTYTIGTSEKDKKIEKMPADEKYARMLANEFNFDHHEIQLEADIVNDLPKMVYMLDEPIGDPAALNTYLICKAARDKGVKVLLSGMGADEIFFGYRRQKATLLTSAYQRVPSVIRKLIGFSSALLPVKAFGKGIKTSRWLKRFLSFAGLPVEEAYMRSYSYYNQTELRELFKEDTGNAYQKLREQHNHIFSQAYAGDPINQMCHTDINMFMTGLNLTYTDRASMAASVEVRVPFIDRELIQMAMQINGKLKYRNKNQKYILKKVAEKYLPHNIIYRPKASFGAPIRSWISNELKSMVDDLLSEKQVNKRGIFNYPFIKRLIDEDRQGVADHAYRIYQLLTLEIWFRQYVDKPVSVNVMQPEPVSVEPG